VTSATSLARALGMSEWAIGVTLVAFGTSVPEIATSIVAALRGHPDLALGNAVGSNIFNVLFVQGTVAVLFQPFMVDPALLRFQFPIMIGFSLVLLLILYSRPRIYRWQGALFLIAYLVFVLFQVR
jgi:cation:H+ antiporter